MVSRIIVIAVWGAQMNVNMQNRFCATGKHVEEIWVMLAALC
jgi:hypothetical protein